MPPRVPTTQIWAWASAVQAGEDTVPHMTREPKNLSVTTCTATSPSRRLYLSQTHPDGLSTSSRLEDYGSGGRKDTPEYSSSMGESCRRWQSGVRGPRLINSRIWDPENGAHYVYDSHWLVHRWVPQECIECEIGIDEFEDFCRDEGIWTGPAGCYIQLSFQRILSFRGREGEKDPESANEEEDVAVNSLIQGTRQLGLGGNNEASRLCV
ncbi:hypothetical protein VTN00DRAFT_9600 [Thermoascus crustaceus]|uniref:uncharacterized protein n=1 Tax=Thermoascus crustaceus TaxID=5088 RepID=UPI003743C968